MRGFNDRRLIYAGLGRRERILFTDELTGVVAARVPEWEWVLMGSPTSLRLTFSEV